MDPDATTFPAATEIGTDRLLLTPLRAADADEMADVLGDERLHTFIGGRPATHDELRDRYGRLAAGSPHPDQAWLNWIVRLRPDGTPVGTVQATVVAGDAGWTASVAWVVGMAWQGRGYAGEAARGLVGWLAGRGVRSVDAAVHPDHHASAAVAARAGLTVTAEVVDGERVWRRDLDFDTGNRSGLRDQAVLPGPGGDLGTVAQP